MNLFLPNNCHVIIFGAWVKIPVNCFNKGILYSATRNFILAGLLHNKNNIITLPINANSVLLYRSNFIIAKFDFIVINFSTNVNCRLSVSKLIFAEYFSVFRNSSFFHSTNFFR